MTTKVPSKLLSNQKCMKDCREPADDEDYSKRHRKRCLLTCMSGLGSSQDWVYRKVAGKPEGASVLVSWAMIVASCGTFPSQT